MLDGDSSEVNSHKQTIHFAASSYLQWNEVLCRKDSDGDGLTNGQELGDPDCVWKKGEAPQRTTDITHPGMAKERINITLFSLPCVTDVSVNGFYVTVRSGKSREATVIKRLCKNMIAVTFPRLFKWKF